MGRKRKIGLEYFPMDVDMFQDIKIRKLIKRQGGKAVVVYTLLLCFIYKNGYYIGGDKELPFIISEQTGFDEVYIQQVISDCLSLGLFSLDMYKKHNVFTSAGIQERYKSICELCRKKYSMDEFVLLDDDENSEILVQESGINVQESGINVQECTFVVQKSGINVAESTQSKVKEIKVKRKKEIIKEKARPFQKPTIEELKLYIEEKGYTVDAERFYNFYESKGWMVGKNKMVSWHAAVSTWQKSSSNSSQYGYNTRQNREVRRGETDFSATSAKDYEGAF